MFARPKHPSLYRLAVLASYKRPRRIEIVADLPRNTMGKLLKRDLRALLWAGRERAI